MKIKKPIKESVVIVDGSAVELVDVDDVRDYQVKGYPVMPWDVYKYFYNTLQGGWLLELYDESDSLKSLKALPLESLDAWKDFRPGATLGSHRSCEFMQKVLNDLTALADSSLKKPWRDLGSKSEEFLDYRAKLVDALARYYFQLLYSINCMAYMTEAICGQLAVKYSIIDPAKKHREPVVQCTLDNPCYVYGCIQFTIIFELRSYLEEYMSTADRIPGASPIGKSPVKQIAKAIIQVRPDYAELLNATDIDSEAILGKSRSSFDIQFVTDIYSLSGHLDHRTKSSAKSFTNLLTERKEIAHVICDKFRDILEAFVDQAEADAKIAADLIAKRGVK